MSLGGRPTSPVYPDVSTACGNVTAALQQPAPSAALGRHDATFATTDALGEGGQLGCRVVSLCMQALAVAGFRGLMLCALLADTVAALALERHLTALHELQAHASCGRVTSVEVSGWGSTGWDKYFKQIERLVASSSSSPPPLPPPPLPSPPPPPPTPPPHHHHHHPERQHFHLTRIFRFVQEAPFLPSPPTTNPPPPLSNPL